ncbi:Nif3-like dinuclear metal center hexameric protein [Desulfofalx alkaliphila]|uniref:Nif3-like dinuclear metal center hexameric protein n=1 Tax=Desulfofalx alkaliphila TaxID=105483 RepID=UPI0004E1C946|nr:Nif3-like dinuclear metal center hexameric protein [Desulfofalx alkaliphila]
MSIKNKQIFKMIEELAPKHLAEEWDNVGLQIGSAANEVQRVLLALDIDEEVVQEAEYHRAQLIITHHPLLIKAIKNINVDTPKGGLIARLLSKGITVYAAHTNLDSAAGGVNSVLAEKLGLQDIHVLHVTGTEKYIKLAVFVPAEDVEQVAAALSGAGAGWIGNYSDCSFRTAGVGTFRPGEGTNPHIGEQSKLEFVEEVKIETIVPQEKILPVIKAMIAAHPYEEVAYDLYPLQNRGPAYGLGRIGTLSREQNFGEFARHVKELLGLEVIKAGGPSDKTIKTVALCGGSAGELWPKAAAKGADVFISGDIKYHTAQDIIAAGLCFIDAGHFHTEFPVIEKLYNYLTSRCAENNLEIEFIISKSQKDPFVYF